MTCRLAPIAITDTIIVLILVISLAVNEILLRARRVREVQEVREVRESFYARELHRIPRGILSSMSLTMSKVRRSTYPQMKNCKDDSIHLVLFPRRRLRPPLGGVTNQHQDVDMVLLHPGIQGAVTSHHLFPLHARSLLTRTTLLSLQMATLREPRFRPWPPALFRQQLSSPLDHRQNCDSTPADTPCPNLEMRARWLDAKIVSVERLVELHTIALAIGRMKVIFG